MRTAEKLEFDCKTTYPATCGECGKEHKALSPFRKPSPGEVMTVDCDGCLKAKRDAAVADELASKKQRLEDTWQGTGFESALCPKRYRQFDPDLFKGNQAKLKESLAWQFGPKGLVLHGHTGQGKTWAAFMIAKREHFAGRRVAIVNGNRLRELVAIAGESNVRYSAELKRIIGAELLILNDPFKVKLTDKVEEALWEIVDERYEEERPNIITMNGVSKNIEPLLSPDRGKAMFRRLKEDNHAIHFPKPSDDE